jgi:Ser/Thr protein kinase RdoA (MazF antagonist)
VEFVFDPWAITNLVPLAGQLRDVLDIEQYRLVGQALEETAGLDREVLPVAMIHADLTKGNVLLGEHDGAVSVLDFAVANRFPRVQELAVIAANLTHGCPDPLPVRVETIAELYSAAAPVPLTPVERDALRAFAHAAAAMESPLPVSGLLPVPRRAWRWRWRRHSHEPGRASHTGLAVAA